MPCLTRAPEKKGPFNARVVVSISYSFLGVPMNSYGFRINPYGFPINPEGILIHSQGIPINP